MIQRLAYISRASKNKSSYMSVYAPGAVAEELFLEAVAVLADGVDVLVRAVTAVVLAVAHVAPVDAPEVVDWLTPYKS